MESELPPRVGDIVYLPNNDTLYEIVDTKLWEEAFGLRSRYTLITLRVYKDTKRTVMKHETIPDDDVIRQHSPSELEAYEPTTDVLKIDPSEIPDKKKVDLFDWEYDFKKR